jgi:cold shock CspA family protein
MKKIGIVLFTTDLRLHDNVILHNAIKENDEVTFDTIEGKKGLQAINVKKV